MAFYNPEGVRTVKSHRETAETMNSDEQLDIFTQQIEELFGKPISKEDLKS